jgi:hypothetical protein
VIQRPRQSQSYFIASALFVSFAFLFAFPNAAHAEDMPANGSALAPVDGAASKLPPDENYQVPADADPSTIDQGNPVKAPGTPVATSPTNDGTIDWEWTTPEGGLTPDAPTTPPEQPAETTNPADPTDDPLQPVGEQPAAPAPTEHATDIMKYGYQLSRNNVVVEQGTVDATSTKVTTSVTRSGDYLFQLWSITRDNHFSDIAYGFITVQFLVVVVPSYPLIDVPSEITTTPVAAAMTNETTADTYYSTASTPPITSSNPVASQTVASAVETVTAAPASAVPPIVKTSSQGWMILGLPWYIWLLALAVGVTAWRWTRMILNEK